MTNKLSLYAAGIGCLFVFTVVPTLANFLDLSTIIYSENVPGGVILSNLMVTFLFFIFGFFSKEDKVFRYEHQNDRALSIYLCLFVIFYLLIFYLSGGTEYRVKDVDLGYANRSSFLRVILVLQNITVVMVIYLIAAFQKLDRVSRLFIFILVFLYLLVSLSSGGRGTTAQIITGFFVYTLIGNKSLLEEKRRKNYLIYFFKNLLKTIFYGSILIFLFGYWGYLRDDLDDLSFGTIFRASEPYWYRAYLNKENSMSIEILVDSLQRIISIPFRWLGVEFQGSIDGKEYYLEHYLGIQFTEGVSLPITLYGQGILFSGYFGVLIFVLLTTLVITYTNRFLTNAYFENSNFHKAFLSYFISKCIFIYAKSLSGIFLYLVYETFRDYILVLILFMFVKKAKPLR